MMFLINEFTYYFFQVSPDTTWVANQISMFFSHDGRLTNAIQISSASQRFHQGKQQTNKQAARRVGDMVGICD